MQPKRTAGAFRWNAGGWFGALVGSTCWMAFVGIGLLAESHSAAGGWLIGCFAVANAIGTAMWMNRDRIDPYRAVQILLAILFAFTAAAIVGVDRLGALKALEPRFQNPRTVYLVLAIFPALMALFRFINGPKRTKTIPDA